MLFKGYRRANRFKRNVKPLRHANWIFSGLNSHVKGRCRHARSAVDWLAELTLRVEDNSPRHPLWPEANRFVLAVFYVLEKRSHYAIKHVLTVFKVFDDRSVLFFAQQGRKHCAPVSVESMHRERMHCPELRGGSLGGASNCRQRYSLIPKELDEVQFHKFKERDGLLSRIQRPVNEPFLWIEPATNTIYG